MVKLFDVNLRQDFYSRNALRRSCEFANAVKLNDQELPIVADLLGIGSTTDDPETRIGQLIRTFSLNFLVLTRGPHGTVLYTSSARHQGEAITYEPVPVADAVGAGDACAAAILLGLLLRWPLDRTVNLANHVGAHVASQGGATPELPESILEMVK